MRPPDWSCGGRNGASRAERAKVAREHRLLGDLLRATDKNLQVLRRLEGRLHGRTRAARERNDGYSDGAVGPVA